MHCKGPIAALFLVLSACSNDASRGEKGLETDAATTLAFDEGTSVRLLTGETRTLHLSGETGIAVSTWLEGAYGDASLDRATLPLDGGRGLFSLRAPSIPAVFSVRAKQAKSPAVSLSVSVSANGFGSVALTTTYQGPRAQTDLAASVVLLKSCAEIEDASVSDGGLVTAGQLGAPIVLDDVPAGVAFAVRVRLAHVATGCKEVASLVPGARSNLEIPLFDVPLRAYGAKLDAELSFSGRTDENARWDAAFQASTDTFLEALISSQTTDAARLIDGMIAASSTPSAYASVATTSNWTASATTWIDAHGGSLRARAASWLPLGLPATRTSFTASFDLDQGFAALTPLSFGPQEGTLPHAVGQPFTWSAGADDRLSFTGVLEIYASRVLASAALAGARLKEPPAASATSLGEALSSTFDCGAFATTLGGGATVSCDASCLTSLCKTAFSKMANDARSASTTPTLSLATSILGSAVVADDATPRSLDGTWAATVSGSANSSAFVGGAMKASVR